MIINEDRIISLVSNNKQEEKVIEKSLRPKTLSEYIGQKTAVEQLGLFIEAAKLRGDVLDHVLIFGPPGLGKTTLANIIAFEMQGNLKITSGPAIEKIKDLGAILTNLNSGDILFIDEIHRLNVSIEETLYNAMEDFKFDIIMGEGPAARNIRIDIAPFTLVGATTRAGMLTKPLFDRFGIVQKLQFYNISDLAQITFDNAFKLKTEIDKKGAMAIAKRSRGTPRIANILLKRVRDYAQVHNANYITEQIANSALNMLGIDESGLDFQDKNYLQILLDIYKGGPAGIESMAASLSEDVRTLEDVVEPYLMQQGYITRTVRGRVATEKTYQKLNYEREK